MSGRIRRIDTYNDNRFAKDVLKQHGAFVVDGIHMCSFKIINKDSAMVVFDNGVDVDKLIEEFRFYSGHIVYFYSAEMALIRSFLPVRAFDIYLKDIQPSQFLVDVAKLKAIDAFIESAEDICIPLAKVGDCFVSMDGHTRLYLAAQKGFATVRAYLADPMEYLWDFVQEARKRNVYSPYDLRLVSHEEYKIEWDQFCDDFFRERD